MRRYLLLLALCAVAVVVACDDPIDPVRDNSLVWETRVVRDIDFVKDRHFYLFDTGGGPGAAPDETEDIRVYRELHLVEVIDPQIISVACRAWLDSTGTGQVIRDALAPLTQGGQPVESRSQFGWFELLVPGVDYRFVNDSEFRPVGVELSQRVRPAARRVLAVAFTNRDGDQVGGYRYDDFRPPEHQSPIDTLALAMIKSRVPARVGEFADAWDYAMRNIYDLGLTDMDRTRFEVVIEDNLIPRVDPTTPMASPDTISVPYLRIFGLDQTDDAGGPPDGRVDLTSGVIKLHSGWLRFPSLTSFAPSEQSVRMWTEDQFWFLDPRFGVVDGGKLRFQEQYEKSQRIYRTDPSLPEFQTLHQYNIVVRAGFPADPGRN